MADVDVVSKALPDHGFTVLSAKLGWKAKTPLEAGLRATYQWWLERGRN